MWRLLYSSGDARLAILGGDVVLNTQQLKETKKEFDPKSGCGGLFMGRTVFSEEYFGKLLRKHEDSVSSV